MYSVGQMTGIDNPPRRRFVAGEASRCSVPTEAVAYVVCRAMGLETTTRSADYIRLYRGNASTLTESLEMIPKTAASLMAELQDESTHSADPSPQEVPWHARSAAGIAAASGEWLCRRGRSTAADLPRRID
jgi:hypothetical protein